jgi:hypothetical protein
MSGTTVGNVDKYVAATLRLRAQLDEEKKAFIEQQKPKMELLAQLEGMLMQALNDAGVNSMAGPSGTFFFSKRTSAKVTDWSAVLDFIAQSGRTELLEQRVSKLAVEAITEEYGAPVPGVQMSVERILNIRKSA